MLRFERRFETMHRQPSRAWGAPRRKVAASEIGNWCAGWHASHQRPSAFERIFVIHEPCSRDGGFAASGRDLPACPRAPAQCHFALT
jgi:hypothetical protein